MIEIRDIEEGDRQWFSAETQAIGGPCVVSDSQLVDLRKHSTRVAWRGPIRVGYMTWRLLDDDRAEVLALMAMERRAGIGSLLMHDAERLALDAGATMMELDTTNDNVGALAFYQAIGFRIQRWRKGAFSEVIEIKNPQAHTPIIGQGGLEITDVIRLSKPITR